MVAVGGDGAGVWNENTTKSNAAGEKKEMERRE